MSEYCACLYTYVCAWCLKSPEDDLEMELQVLVNFTVGPGNWTGVLWKSSFLTAKPSLQPSGPIFNSDNRKIWKIAGVLALPAEASMLCYLLWTENVLTSFWKH